VLHGEEIHMDYLITNQERFRKEILSHILVEKSLDLKMMLSLLADNPQHKNTMQKQSL